jgi:L,D-peptidoglycan transpeptidase YkuD (ErfK/YbiS/YcfS/YnhG family)
MDLRVSADGILSWPGGRARAALGRAGLRASAAKREGDGATPIGAWPLRLVLWRADRLAAPATRLAVQPIAPDDGWCDAPADPLYNRRVLLPYPASAEHLWREDRLYDLIVVLGYNDAPIKPGAGSAVFLHLAAPDYQPTQGCVAAALPDLARMLAGAGPEDRLIVG